MSLDWDAAESERRKNGLPKKPRAKVRLINELLFHFSFAGAGLSKDVREEFIQLLDTESGQAEILKVLVELLCKFERLDIEDSTRRIVASLARPGYEDTVRKLLIEATEKADVIAETDESPFWDADDLNGLR